MHGEARAGVVIVRGAGTGFAQEIIAGAINSPATNQHQWAAQTAAPRGTTYCLLDLARARP